jgi:hypothetical protein
MAEEIIRCETIEEARNRALDWLASHAPWMGPFYKVELGRLGVGEGHEVGVSSLVDPYQRIRLDYDPVKGCHYNVEVGKGGGRVKAAFTFPGSEAWLSGILTRRGHR